MNKKITFLFLALLLPVCIFVFLKIFGKNEFDVPILYPEGVTGKPAACKFDYAVPYLVPDSVFERLADKNESMLYLINLTDSAKALQRVFEEVGTDNLKEVSVFNISDSSGLQVLKDCILLVRAPASIVMIDRQKQIRGYYNAADLDDMDRLIVESKIILKKY